MTTVHFCCCHFETAALGWFVAKAWRRLRRRQFHIEPQVDHETKTTVYLVKMKGKLHYAPNPTGGSEDKIRPKTGEMSLLQL